jgi:hypothetical protein
MLQFFFNNPGTFYGFGYSPFKKLVNERRLKNAIFDYFDPVNKFKNDLFPLVANDKAAAFGSELFFHHALSLVKGVKKDLKEKDYLKIKEGYPFSINSLIFFLCRFIEVLEEEINEGRFSSLVLFLKDFLNCIILGDPLVLKKRVNFFYKGFKNFSIEFSSESDIFLFLGLILKFLDIFDKRFDGFSLVFNKNVQFSFATFMNSCLVPENMGPMTELKDILELCLDFGFKMIRVRSFLVDGNIDTGEGSLTQNYNMDTYIYGSNRKFDLNEFYFNPNEKAFYFNNFNSFFKFFTFFPIVLTEVEHDHTIWVKARIAEIESRFEYYEKRLDFNSVYLQTHPELGHLVKLANEYEGLKKLIVEVQDKIYIENEKNKLHTVSFDRKLYDFFEFFDNNYVNFFSKKFNRIRHKIPLPSELPFFSDLRVYDDVRWDFWFFSFLNIGHENFNKNFSNLNANRYFSFVDKIPFWFFRDGFDDSFFYFNEKLDKIFFEVFF